SGPVQPPMLGASIASAKIHLTDEIYELQKQLKEKLVLTQDIIKHYDLPLVLPSENHSPIFYIGLGLPRVGYNMVNRLLKEGYYTNIGIFPGVPVKCCGLRLAITNGQTKEDIKEVLAAFAYHFPKVLEEERISVDDISLNFNMEFDNTKKCYEVKQKNAVANNFIIQIENSIQKIDIDLWNNLLGDEGSFDWHGCKFIEESFKDNPEPENNWNLTYLIIMDENDVPVLATFFTELICKDDMISPSSVSEQIEEIRTKNPYYLTSKVITMGSLLSEGNHLFLQRDHPKWKNALLEMIRIMNEVKEKSNATAIHLRDIDTSDTEIRDFLIKEGFFKAPMQDTHIVENLKWNNNDEFLNTLSYRSRKHVRKFIFKTEHEFEVSFIKNSDYTFLDECYKLYLNVKKQSFVINTFDLPIKMFKNVFDDPNWEVMLLKVGPLKKLGCFVFCYKSQKNNYCPVVIGLDYEYNNKFFCYRQALFQLLKRANQLMINKVYLGMDATIEKQKVGATVIPKSIYIQANNNYNMDVISLFKQN
ncbi:MAG TPA: aminotransferase class I/II, partial [Bacteroidia bacterium]|nr:aminotransferase class I/II [Bacteroidia bacterium]